MPMVHALAIATAMAPATVLGNAPAAAPEGGCRPHAFAPPADLPSRRSCGFPAAVLHRGGPINRADSVDSGGTARGS